MSNPVTNRIVGTLVLLALLAIILPELLREPQAPTPEKFEVIPLRPELSGTPQPATYPADALANTTAEPKAQPLPDTPVQQQGDAQASPATAPEQPVADKTAATVKQPATSTQQQTAVAKNIMPATSGAASNTAPAAGADAWVVQMGAFGNHTSAEALVTKLRQAGYKAFLIKEHNLSKVLVGPELDKQRLAEKISELNKLTGLKGRLFHYDPLQ